MSKLTGRRCSVKKKKGLFYVKRHSCFLLQYHMVLVMKYRRPALTGDVKKCVYGAIREGLENRGCRVIDMNGEPDHVHILFEAPPDEKLTELANVLKTRSARMTWKRYPRELRKFYWGEKHLFWTDSYFVTTVGYNTEAVVSCYIRNQ